MKRMYLLLFVCLFLSACQATVQEKERRTEFNDGWKFHLGEIPDASSPQLDDAAWKTLNLPHDWSIEGDFSEKNPSGFSGGALPGGTGWYRKTFTIGKEQAGKKICIDFNGVYMHSEVYINGQLVGKRPYGYISFRYDLTPYIKFGESNVIAVKADNSRQPNSRWYSGSGIYRNVWLTILDSVHVDLWGTYVTTPKVTATQADIVINTTVRNEKNVPCDVEISTTLLDAQNKSIRKMVETLRVSSEYTGVCRQTIVLDNPRLWSPETPYLYQVKTELRVDGKLTDTYYTTTGVRTFTFDAEKGFSLNGKSMKIKGVCLHHDLGCLGAAVNYRALERQLEILKEMGCNGIRTAHNPPTPELLELCDRMGFIVQDEVFDMWRKTKSEYDYSKDFLEWYERDLTDFILRDRNHPSIFTWSIGNEIWEQWSDSFGDTLSVEYANQLFKLGLTPEEVKEQSDKHPYTLLTTRLTEIVRKLDPTRPISTANNETEPRNLLIQLPAPDLIGFNYNNHNWEKFNEKYPGRKLLITESTSGLMTRGYYEMPSDSIFIRPHAEKAKFDRPLKECSAYDNCHVPWGSTHEKSWDMVKTMDHIPGYYVWTGFDYIGEPTPYEYPARSSYFGIIDLAGFPKDVYYMYQSEWTNKKVLHLFPHWNWEKGQEIDLWVYYNNADEVELLVNGKSQGIKRKGENEYHLSWRVKYEPGTVKAISRKNGQMVLEQEIRTAGEPAQIRLTADRRTIKADGKDLSFVTVEILDKNGTLCPNADNLVRFEVSGNTFIAGVDNGSPYSMERFKDNKRKAFYGKCLVVLQNDGTKGKSTLKAISEGLEAAEITLSGK